MFMMFQAMLEQLKDTVISRLAHMVLSVENMDEDRLGHMEDRRHVKETRVDPSAVPQEPAAASSMPVRMQVRPEDRDPSDPSTWGKVGRNELCPCGSGKKYKHCHGKLT